MAKSPRRKQQLQFYSDAADQCTYIRDIWRNEVADTRGTYNDGESLGIMTRVRQFMQLPAKEPGYGSLNLFKVCQNLMFCK
jgi:hypothetical protein